MVDDTDDDDSDAAYIKNSIGLVFIFISSLWLWLPVFIFMERADLNDDADDFTSLLLLPLKEHEGVGFMRNSKLITIDDSKATLVYKLRLPLLHTMLL